MHEAWNNLCRYSWCDNHLSKRALFYVTIIPFFLFYGEHSTGLHLLASVDTLVGPPVPPCDPAIDVFALTCAGV